MTTTLSNLVEDIYKVVDGQVQIDDNAFDNLARSIAETLKNRLSQSDPVRKTLGLSSVGKPLRRLWYELKSDVTDMAKPSPDLRLKFLYGDIIEDILLWLAEVSGHTVTDRQKEVEYRGVVGHIDSIIDGEVVDIKSASATSFKKFDRGTLPDDDPFGYLAQITAYDKVVGKGNPAFLVMDKVTGQLTLYRPDPVFDMPDVDGIIDKAREALSSNTPPKEPCYQPVPDGTSGNMKLSKGCSYCPFKKLCFPELRMFKYSDGIRYLTKVVKEPRVEELTDD